MLPGGRLRHVEGGRAREEEEGPRRKDTAGGRIARETPARGKLGYWREEGYGGRRKQKPLEVPTWRFRMANVPSRPSRGLQAIGLGGNDKQLKRAASVALAIAAMHRHQAQGSSLRALQAPRVLRLPRSRFPPRFGFRVSWVLG